jgi:HAD superfamily hydrolase (TIGR01459 family)
MTMQALSRRYPVWFCDVWGVVHNGHDWFKPAAEALRQHRQNGGIVVLLTNSPRTSRGVIRQLDEIGVPPESYDLVVTSGDVTQALVKVHGQGKVFHLGPARDLSIFEDQEVERVPVEDAHAVLCTGLFHDTTETPADYDVLLKELQARHLPFICANPDKVVRKGKHLLYCAGALAEVYASLGGTVLMAGKPYTPIYDLAVEQARHLRQQDVAQPDILAIGDGPETDIRGAAAYRIACVLIADGVLDASAGLAAVTAAVQRQVPQARIVETLGHLHWA